MIPVSTEQPTPAQEDEHRAAVVAGIRALADLIESNPNLPVPDSVNAQHSPLGHTAEVRIAITRDAAAQLGVEATITDETSDATLTIAKGGYKAGLPWFTVDYTVHGSVKHDRKPGGAA